MRGDDQRGPTRICKTEEVSTMEEPADLEASFSEHHADTTRSEPAFANVNGTLDTPTAAEESTDPIKGR